MKKTTPPKKDLKPKLVKLTSGIDYEFLDGGKGRKLERFGKYVFDRPEQDLSDNIRSSRKDWESADWHFYEHKGKKGDWTNKTSAAEAWTIDYAYQNLKLSFNLKITSFKHIGIFPEQAENWKFIQRELISYQGEVKVLNLFAYTGAASLVAAASGAQVTNVDSVKQVLNWGRENAELNKVENIRWILEDARKFVQKAVRRGDKYQGIIVDPPAFGLGSKNEKWKLEKDLAPLLEDIMKLLHPKRHFFIMNTYSPKMPLMKLKNMLNKIEGFPKKYEANMLGLKSDQNHELPLGNLVRFSK